MPLHVTIQITSDASNPLTETDQGILRALAATNGSAAPTEFLTGAVHMRENPESPTPVAAAAPKAAAKVAPKPEPTPEPEEDLLGGAATLEDAVARATTLVASGKTAQVKAALAAAGAKRVSELSGAKIGVFLGALDA